MVDGPDFRILGPVGVWHHECQLRPTNAQQRTLLAMFLLTPGTVVSFDHLVTGLWGESPPASARNAVQGHVSRLRKLLTGLPEVGLVTAGQGYRLDVDPQLVDLHRFRTLAERARDSPPAEAGELLGAALALWRGPVFVDVAGDWLPATVAPALEEERLRACEHQAEVELGLGRHVDVVARLSTLAARYPLRESLLALLMTALHLSGRRCDALTLFRDTRQRFVDELGIEPGQQLQRLHRRLLDQEPPTTAPLDRLPAAEGCPRQLPADVAYFTGRERQLAMLDALLPQDSGVVTTGLILVSGGAGVGKTALTVHWAHRVAHLFPDGQLFLDLRGFHPTGSVMSPAEALSRLLSALRVPAPRLPADVAGQADLFRTIVADKRLLLVLDNARDADQVRPLLPGATGCLVLVNSRQQMPGLVAAHGAHPLTLDRPSPQEAWELLSARIGERRLAAEPAAGEEIITRCGRLPLALAVVAARAVTNPDFPLAALAAELCGCRGGLDAFANGDASTDVRSVFSWSYGALGEEAARLFRLLGLHPGPEISVSAAASLADRPVGRTRPLLGELTRIRLLNEHAPGRYAFHDLLRAYATELVHTVDPAEVRRAALRRFLDHCLHTARRADLLLEPNRDPVPLTAPAPGADLLEFDGPARAAAWFAEERGVLLAAVEHAAAERFSGHAWQLAWVIKPVLSRQGHWHDQLVVLRVAVAAADDCGDRAAQAELRRYLASTYDRLGRYPDAHRQYQQALDLHLESGNRTGQAHVQLDVARLLDRQQRNHHALRHAQLALDLYRQVGHRIGQARSLSGLGWEHAQLGELDQALARCQEALALLQEIGDRHGEAESWDSVGYIHHQRGDHRRAIECYRRCIDLLGDFGDRFVRALSTTHLGESLLASGDPDGADEAWRSALRILDDLDHPGADRLSDRIGRLLARPVPAHRATGSSRTPTERAPVGR
ncbi:AfsR/SARP family transcriptional regulator [Micromonospora coxensis]|uniref:AfsR/SARP family transcriptional regulator n=1 Tax=Micromonospora coxensis TaxID=356852 RepID=UPI00342601B3